MAHDIQAKKSLGQHWLHEARYLEKIIDSAGIKSGDNVLEIGPGTGTLTELLLSKGALVTAVEIDSQLVEILESKFLSEGSGYHSSLKVVHQNILDFDLASLSANYKVTANIPYYLTGKIVRFLLESNNPPSQVVLLVQKEVAERLVAEPGQMSVLALSAQFYSKASLGVYVPAEAFSPPPKVDSQVVILDRLATPTVEVDDKSKFFRLIKAGFAERRKKLRSSLSGGLHMSKVEIDQLLSQTNIPADARAQELSLEDWARLNKVLQSTTEI